MVRRRSTVRFRKGAPLVVRGRCVHARAARIRCRPLIFARSAHIDEQGRERVVSRSPRHRVTAGVRRPRCRRRCDGHGQDRSGKTLAPCREGSSARLALGVATAAGGRRVRPASHRPLRAVEPTDPAARRPGPLRNRPGVDVDREVRRDTGRPCVRTSPPENPNRRVWARQREISNPLTRDRGGSRRPRTSGGCVPRRPRTP